MINREIIVATKDSIVTFKQDIVFKQARYTQNNTAEKYISELIENNTNFSVTIQEKSKD